MLPNPLNPLSRFNPLNPLALANPANPLNPWNPLNPVNPVSRRPLSSGLSVMAFGTGVALGVGLGVVSVAARVAYERQRNNRMGGR